MHWLRHRTHYDVTVAYRGLRNRLTVHLNNGATRTDPRGLPKHCKIDGEIQGVNRQYTGNFGVIFFITRYGINPCLYSGFLWARCSPWDIEHRVGSSPFGLHLTGDISSLGRRRHTSMDKEIAIKSLYFSFQSTVNAIILYSTSYMYVLDKKNTLWLRDTVRQTSLGKSVSWADPRPTVGYHIAFYGANLRHQLIFLTSPAAKWIPDRPTIQIRAENSLGKGI